MNFVHYPVLKKEVFSNLNPSKEDKLLIDCTLGEGGHSEFFLSQCNWLKVIGLDADPVIQEEAKKRLKQFEQRIIFKNCWFDSFFEQYSPGDEQPDLILFDLGISIFHYEKSGRGFSFSNDEPLDMRISKELEICASDIINEYSEKEIADILYLYGEERLSRRFAKEIVANRQISKIMTTGQLEKIIFKASPSSYRHGRINPATRSFQALRIAVNGELIRLEPTLKNAFKVLKPGGRMAVITFHSLEDRIVKHFFKSMNLSCICPPEQPICNCKGRKLVEILTKKPVTATEAELKKNPPSRSAKLRVVKKIKNEDF